MSDDEIIFPDDPRAARLIHFREIGGDIKIELWVSRDGWVHIPQGSGLQASEQMARHSGSTHIRCQGCNSPIPKRGFLICDDCRVAKDAAKFLAMPTAPWPQEHSPLIPGVFCRALDEYFDDLGELLYRLAEEEIAPDDAELVICQPLKLRHIDPSDFDGDLPEDVELPASIVRAVDDLNAVIDGEIVGWEESARRLEIDDEMRASYFEECRRQDLEQEGILP